MRNIKEILSHPRFTVQEVGDDGGWGLAILKDPANPALVIFSWGGGWDHVSVSYKDLCPTWEEMCLLKDIFFQETEAAIQYHPAQKDYVNIHPNCLHLWRPQKKTFPQPPKWMLGPSNETPEEGQDPSPPSWEELAMMSHKTLMEYRKACETALPVLKNAVAAGNKSARLALEQIEKALSQFHNTP